MSNYSALKTAIQQAVYTNGNNEITGAGLQAVLLQIVNTVGDGYVFKGVATAGTAPGTPDQNVFYLAPGGTYTNFGSSFTVNDGELGVISYNGSWAFSSINLKQYYGSLHFFLNPYKNGHNLNNFVKELYIEGLAEGTTYCLRTLRVASGIVQMNIGTSSGNVIQINTSSGTYGYAHGKSGNIEVWVIFQNMDEFTTETNLIFANGNTSICTLNKDVCENIVNAPYIYSYINEGRITVLESEITQYFANAVYNGKDLNTFFKEFYIEGLTEGTTYCLRTLRRINTLWQINIGTASGNVVQLDGRVANGGYCYGESGGIKAYAVLTRLDELTGAAIFANADASICTLTDSASDLSNAPYISGIVNAASNRAESIPIAFNGYSLPKNPTSLKILCVGNSFVDQPLSKLPMWLNGLGITQVTCGIVTKSGGSLQQHYEGLNTIYDAYLRISGNNGTTQGDWVTVNPSTHQPENVQIMLSQAFSYFDWDIITFQQSSTSSGKYTTIEQYLPELIAAARYYCPNAGVKIGWHQTWAYAQGYTGLSDYGNSQEQMITGIIGCSKNVAADSGLDLIIPNGIVMQNLRSIPNTFWGDDVLTIKGYDTYSASTPNADFTDDGLHPNNFAEYCLCATFVQMLILACFNRTIRGSDVLGGFQESYAKAGRQCVLRAIGDRFNVSDIDTNNLE